MPDPSLATSLLFLREEELHQGIELMLSAARDFSAAADDLLETLGLERVHYRALHYVARQPNITMTALGALLGLTKQSLGRALEPLLADKILVERVGPQDRRQRLLSLTEKGMVLEKQISDRMRVRIARAYREAGAQAVEGFRRVLLGLIDDPVHRQHFERSTGRRA